jgi:hypothetical protein
METREGWMAVAVLALATTSVAQIGVLRQWPLPSTSWAFLVGDLDDDGVQDLVMLDQGTLRLHSTLASTVLATYPIAASSSAVHSVANAGDVNGDGRDDVFVIVAGATAVEIRLLATPTGTPLFVRGGYPLASMLWGCIARLDDLDGDGRAEFLVGDPFATVGGLTNAGRLDVIDGATLTVVRSHFGAAQDEGLGRVTTVGDLDGDGRRDYLLMQPGALTACSGASGQMLYQIGTSTQQGALMDVGDVDADGRDDFSYFDPALSHGASSSYLAVISGRTGAVHWQHSYPIGYQAYQLISGRLGDIDGDAHADLCVFGSQWSWNIASTVLSGINRRIHFESTSAMGRLSGSPGDVDGDGFVDFWAFTSGPTPPFATPVVRVISGAPIGVVVTGPGCPDATGVVPTLGIGVGARLGRTLSINLSGAHPGTTAAVLGLGYSQSSWSGVPLPLDLGALGLPGCAWRVSSDASLLIPSVPLVGGRRRSTYEIPVPNNPQLLGLDVFCQWVTCDPATWPLGAAVTRAVRTRVAP